MKNSLKGISFFKKPSSALKALVLLAIFFCISPFAYSYEAVEFGFGYLRAGLPKDAGSYEALPVTASFHFKAENFFKIFKLENSPRHRFLVEPFASWVFNPSNNIELGSNFLVQYVFAFASEAEFYFKAGAGLAYITQENSSQKEGFNFAPQAGFGVRAPVSEKLSAGVEYRFRHFSNAGRVRPNSGIDAGMLLFTVKIKAG